MSSVKAAAGHGKEDVLDYTVESDQDADQHTVRLSRGIDVRTLLEQRDGVIFEPEIDESLFAPPTNEDRTYFANADAGELEDKLNMLGLGVGGAGDATDNEDDDDTFEGLARKMQPVTPDGGVKKRLLAGGDESTGCPPDRGTITVHYTLYLESQDEPFDSTVLRGRPERHRLDVGAMLPGLEIAVKTMRKKERAEFLLESWTMFGRMGCPPRVPGEATILAKIEMLDFYQEAEAEALLALDPEERARGKSYDDIEKVARKEHIEGNEMFKNGEFKVAARRYERGIRLLEDANMQNDEEERRQKHLRQKLLLNRSFCCLKVHWPRRACLDLQKALREEPGNAKALYRMGKAKRMLGNYDDAKHYLMRARRAKPDDTDIGRELADLDHTLYVYQQNERATCQRMFPGAQIPKKEKDYSQEVSDEVYEELFTQLKGFKEDQDQMSLPLPASLGEAEIALTKSMAASLDLEMAEVDRGSLKHWQVVKKAS